jgi:hypothetical protein
VNELNKQKVADDKKAEAELKKEKKAEKEKQEKQALEKKEELNKPEEPAKNAPAPFTDSTSKETEEKIEDALPQEEEKKEEKKEKSESGGNGLGLFGGLATIPGWIADHLAKLEPDWNNEKAVIANFFK